MAKPEKDFGIRRGFGPFDVVPTKTVPTRVDIDLLKAVSTATRQDRTVTTDEMSVAAAVNEGLGRFVLARIDGLDEEKSVLIVEALGGPEAVADLRTAIEDVTPAQR